MSIPLTDNDRAQIATHGMSVEQVERQIADFRRGFDFLPIDRAATISDGIVRLTDAQVRDHAADYERKAPELAIEKFVPASGAATRMFKELFEFVQEGKSSKVVEQTLARIDDFAFGRLVERGTPQQTIEAIIGPEGLDYGGKPKALILFHKYPDGARTAAEEHLAEGAMYAASQGRVRIHFTISGEHRAGFEELFARVLPGYERQLGVKFSITYSQQDPATDTIAVAPDNTPFREPDGSLLFRPAGHGALLRNLGALDADIVFVKTIDNVQPDARKADTLRYKKALAGLLLSLQEQAFAWQKRLSEETLGDACKFVQERLMFRLPADFERRERGGQLAYIRRVLDRPIRVCGVVRNEGEPGGGPFWVKMADGATSLQIAESSQIAPQDMELMRGATHFNPVDLVCALKDAHGGRYDLTKFTDPATGFISEKSKAGKPLRAQELPGLWNGAMADWSTIFVEVPITTFSPVKTIVDLLREQHQPYGK